MRPDVMPVLRVRGEIHSHHWFRAVSSEGHVLWLCPCGLLVDWTEQRRAWAEAHPELDLIGVATARWTPPALRRKRRPGRRGPGMSAAARRVRRP